MIRVNKTLRRKGIRKLSLPKAKLPGPIKTPAGAIQKLPKVKVPRIKKLY